MEKIKDFIYEKSDVFFASLVIVAVVGVVFYNLSGWMVIDGESSRYHQVPVHTASADSNKDATTNTEQNTENNPQENTSDAQNSSDSTTTESSTDAEKTTEAQSSESSTAAQNTTDQKTTENATSDNNSTETTAPAQTTTPAQNQTNSSTTQPSTTKPATNTNAERNITIAAGSSASSIASALKTQGIITDSQAFLNKIAEMKKETKLKAGTFKIPAGASMEDVINILTK